MIFKTGKPKNNYTMYITILRQAVLIWSIRHHLSVFCIVFKCIIQVFKFKKYAPHNSVVVRKTSAVSPLFSYFNIFISNDCLLIKGFIYSILK